MDFIRKGYFGLRFSPAVEATVKSRPGKPQANAREARREVQNVGIGTKSQQALGLQHEQMKTERKVLSRQKREEEKQRLFELKQQKRKESTGQIIHRCPPVHLLFKNKKSCGQEAFSVHRTFILKIMGHWRSLRAVAITQLPDRAQ